MTTLLVEHDSFGQHETPQGHPEQQDRYASVAKALADPDLENMARIDAPLGEWGAIRAAHTDQYFDDIRSLAGTIQQDLVHIDADTTMGPHSLDAALRGVGGACHAVDEVFTGRASNAFVAARPPGHHAEANRAMGFCIFNNAAIAARYARQAHGCEKIAVVDFDVHHGNGTQAIFADDERAFFASSHEWPQYPGTGRTDEHGIYGNCHNQPLSPGSGGLEFRRAWGDRLLPALDAFAPDVIVVSAGFDAHTADPLGGLCLVEDDFAWITAELLGLAQHHCHGRLISVLEGGYDLSALASSVKAHVKTLAMSTFTG